ncbi:hypothetical protein Ddc_07189 [Ditylenchus destructor]|nr:hypothetical protein Ddc_07189 [Ditylenchus destructor]
MQQRYSGIVLPPGSGLRRRRLTPSGSDSSARSEEQICQQATIMGAEESTMKDVITLSDDDTESTISVHTGNEDNVLAIEENQMERKLRLLHKQFDRLQEKGDDVQSEKCFEKIGQLEDNIETAKMILEKRQKEIDPNFVIVSYDDAPLRIAGTGIEKLDLLLTQFANDPNNGHQMALRCLNDEIISNMLNGIRTSGDVPDMDAIIEQVGGNEQFMWNVMELYTRLRREFFSSDQINDYFVKKFIGLESLPEPPAIGPNNSMPVPNCSSILEAMKLHSPHDTVPVEEDGVITLETDNDSTYEYDDYEPDMKHEKKESIETENNAQRDFVTNALNQPDVNSEVADVKMSENKDRPQNSQKSDGAQTVEIDDDENNYEFSLDRTMESLSVTDVDTTIEEASDNESLDDIQVVYSTQPVCWPSQRNT